MSPNGGNSWPRTVVVLCSVEIKRRPTSNPSTFTHETENHISQFDKRTFDHFIPDQFSIITLVHQNLLFLLFFSSAHILRPAQLPTLLQCCID